MNDITINTVTLNEDPYSCSHCEAIYHFAILNDISLQPMTCDICKNSINAASLEHYLKKYKSDIFKLKEQKLTSELNKQTDNTVLSEYKEVMTNQQQNSSNNFETFQELTLTEGLNIDNNNVNVNIKNNLKENEILPYNNKKPEANLTIKPKAKLSKN